MTWPRGSPVTIRSRPNGDVGYTFPAAVILDAPQMIALFQPAGTVCKRRGGPRGGPGGRYLVKWDGTFKDVVFGLSTAHVHVPGDGFWVIRYWTGDRYTGWYVNLAASWRRTPIGFDHEDRALDINVANDLSTWNWKDEDGLAWLIERGEYSPEKGEEIRAAGVEAVARMEARQPPFHNDWSGLVPDQDWPVPELAAAWETFTFAEDVARWRT